MKIVCFADSHVNSAKYGRLDPESGLNTRTQQSLQLVNEVVDNALAMHADVLVFAGDAFRNPTPPPTVADRCAAALARAAAKMKVLVLDGNHDVPPQENQVSCLSMFATLQVPNVLQTRFATSWDVTGADGQQVRFATLPTHHTLASIKETMDRVDTSVPTIVVGHLTVRGAKLNEWTNAEAETDIPLEVLTKKGVLAVVLGHLHEHQVLSEDPLVFYCGSTNRVDFGEEGQTKGFVVLDVVHDKVSHKFVPLDNAQRFVTIDMTTDADEATAEVIAAMRQAQVYDAVVRVRLNCTAATLVNERDLLAEASARGVTHMMKIAKTVVDAEDVATAANALPQSTTAHAAVEAYFADQPRAKERTKLALSIVNAVDSKTEVTS